MTVSTIAQIHCDGCANGSRNVVTTSWTRTGPPVGRQSWKRSTVLKDLGWKQFRKSKTLQARAFCPDCVAKGLAK